jgi:hypothetical protein
VIGCGIYFAIVFVGTAGVVGVIADAGGQLLGIDA